MGFAAVAGLTLAGAIFVALALPAERNFRPVTGGLGATLATYRLHLRNRRLLATCLIGFGMLFSNVAIYTFVNFLLAAPPYSFSPAQLGGVFVVYLLGVVTTSLAGGLAVRIGRIATLALGLGLSGLGLVCTLVPMAASIVLGLAFLSAGLFVVQALCIGLVPTLVTEARSTAVGLYVTIYYIGGALGGFVPALAYHAAGWPGVVVLVGCVFGAMMALAARQWPGRVASAALQQHTRL